MQKKVAVIGTNGIPANYGGFETLTEHLVKELSAKYNFTVFCSKPRYKSNLRENYLGAKLKYIPLKANGWQAVLYDLWSLLKAIRTNDSILVLGASGGFFLFINAIFKKNIILNHGGFNEWEREKYGWFAKKWSIISRRIASKFATHHIGDNPVLGKSLKEKFNIDSNVIEYGGDHAEFAKIEEGHIQEYPFLQTKYAICVARAQVDNNIHLLIDAYKGQETDHNLVIVSNWNISEYGRELWTKFHDKYSNIILLPAVYDIGKLNVLRSNAYFYIHSHSYCGTAPSLVEAMNLGLPVFSYDVPTNRYTTDGKAFFFDTAYSLQRKITEVDSSQLEECRNQMAEIANGRYKWDIISKKYSDLF